ncbi:SDR family NAD(P)-dependent oxidoreductase [Patulibacter minatonensis]|uniref:SDR family NAD(P)-dependent oxidoreductase n=1 Tax=Patulibacter minatonensis TaxID=298163 RepID=UPI00047D8E8D|nr:SDR family oxidoreductase [Patulibacter minatonensis]
MDLQLAGKRALVTGGSRGIGLAIGRALAREGATVALLARDEAAVALAAEELGAETGARTLGVSADTGGDADVRRAVDEVTAAFGGIDIAINAAARPASSGPAMSAIGTTDDRVREELEVKLLGYLRVARAVAPQMVDRGWGRIVNVSGLNARRSGSVAGSVRNVAVAALTKNLADELGPLGVNVTVVHPGLTRTERTPAMVAARAEQDGSTEEEAEAALAADVSIGRIVDAAEVADVVAFLASPRSVAINGDAIAAGGGQTGPIFY